VSIADVIEFNGSVASSRPDGMYMLSQSACVGCVIIFL
jgi:hypothetical protein